jgi:hypothetical protein
MIKITRGWGKLFRARLEALQKEQWDMLKKEMPLFLKKNCGE